MYVALPGTGERTKKGGISIPIQGELELLVIGGILESAGRLGLEER